MQQRTLVALKTITPLVLLSFSPAARAQTVIPTAVNWTDVHQTMDGLLTARPGTGPLTFFLYLERLALAFLNLPAVRPDFELARKSQITIPSLASIFLSKTFPLSRAGADNDSADVKALLISPNRCELRDEWI